MNRQAKRLRPDWPVRVWAFDLHLTQQPAQEVWDLAHSMQDLWNELASLTDGLREQLDACPDKEGRKLILRDLTQRAYQTTVGKAFSTYCKWDVYNRWQTTLTEWLKGKRGRPRQHKGLRKIRLVKSFYDGGRPITWLYRNSTRAPVYVRFTYRGKTSGYFAVEKQAIAFDLVMNPAPPKTAILKHIALVARLERPFGWKWQLQLTTEEPPVSIARSSTDRVAAIDLGWRLLDDGVRVATLVDASGQVFQIVCPFTLANRDRRRESDIRKCWDLDSASDLLLERCKRDLASQLEFQSLGITKESFRLMRHRGLFDLQRRLREQSPDHPALLTLQQWSTDNAYYFRRVRAIETAFIRVRHHLYREIAAELWEHYDIIVLEGGLDLRKMKTGKLDPSLVAARRYSQLAAPGLFRLALTQSATKRAGALVAEDMVDSTRTCSEDGSAVDPGADLILTCEAGHLFDQDANAARILLQRYLDLPWATPKLREGTEFLAAVRRSQNLRALRPVRFFEIKTLAQPLQ
jgi:hypothetical protein